MAAAPRHLEHEGLMKAQSLKDIRASWSQRPKMLMLMVYRDLQSVTRSCVVPSTSTFQPEVSVKFLEVDASAAMSGRLPSGS